MLLLLLPYSLLSLLAVVAASLPQSFVFCVVAADVVVVVVVVDVVFVVDTFCAQASAIPSSAVPAPLPRPIPQASLNRAILFCE